MLPLMFLGNAMTLRQCSRVTTEVTKWSGYSLRCVCLLRSGPSFDRLKSKRSANFRHSHLMADDVPKGTRYPVMERMKAGMGAHSSGPMTILGIESSFDDTGVAVVDETKTVLGASSRSQLAEHLKTGGVVPLKAAALHKQYLEEVTNMALKKSGRTLEEIGAIAVTVGPGLKPCLLEGIKYAKELASKAKKPLIPIHHIEAHALTSRLLHSIPFPYLALICSGGHCILAIAHSVNKYVVLGQCLDDSPGEALDKCARSMQLYHHPDVAGMSGGAAIEKLAERGNRTKIQLMKLPIMSSRLDCNFSFSGLKSACAKFCFSMFDQGWDRTTPVPLCEDVAAAVQDAALVHISSRLERALIYSRIKNPNIFKLVASGGVVSNKVLICKLEELTNFYNFKLFFPPPELCTDNGIMIAWCGMERVLALEAGTFYPQTDMEWMTGVGVYWSEEEVGKLEPYGQLPFGECFSDKVEEMKLSLSRQLKSAQHAAVSPLIIATPPQACEALVSMSLKRMRKQVGNLHKMWGVKHRWSK